MPIKYRCKSCGFILFEFTRVGQDYYGVPTPEEVYRIYGGICPRCKSMLEVPLPGEIKSRIIIRSTIQFKHAIPGGVGGIPSEAASTKLNA
ncbi:hypothetical protein [Desulfurococcus amylolyticus]|uniref:hypothetical protein n=1 Tax=Desulfurococcus amylolyticus TaxID=94694 RepID=UPI0023EFAB46|nr:hypothetical protein [Desulfurococcus amylolyticus]